MRIITAFLVLVTPTSSFAWNHKGHRVIASIAYRQLDEQTKRKIAEVLKKHPAYADLWANRPTNGPDEILEPALERLGLPRRRPLGALERYGRSPAHYVNYRILADQGNRVEPPVRGENILNSYVAHLQPDPEPTHPGRGQSSPPVLGLSPSGRYPPAAPRRCPVLEGVAPRRPGRQRGSHSQPERTG